jgi:hypothetical protein
MKLTAIPLKSLQKFCDKNDFRPALQKVDVQNGMATATDVFRIITVPTDAPDAPVEGFPKWKQIIPTTDPLATFSVNGKYMAELCSVLAKLGSISDVKVQFHGAGQPLVLKAGDGKGFALLMPLRS